MLEATVRMDTGELVGVVCHEHVGPIRQWVLDERSFAASIADMVTRALTDDRRRRLTAALAHSEERYRTYVSISTEAILGAEFDPPVKTDLPLARQADEVRRRAVIVECNPALARMLGVSSTDLLRGRSIAQLLPEGVARRIASRMGAGGLPPERARIPDYRGRRPAAMGAGFRNVGLIKDGALTDSGPHGATSLDARARSPRSSIRRGTTPLTGPPEPQVARRAAQRTHHRVGDPRRAARAAADGSRPLQGKSTTRLGITLEISCSS
jgi:PAS domain-containing protein